MRVTLNKKIENEFVFNTEGLYTFQSTTGASQNQMNKMTNFIRRVALAIKIEVSSKKLSG